MSEQQHAVAEGSTSISPERRLEMRRQLFANYGVDFPMPPERKPARRLAFHELRIARLLAGLVAAGFGSASAMMLMASIDADRKTLFALSFCLIAAEALWAAPGALALLALWRMRGFIRLVDCLAVGALIGLILPYVSVQFAQLLGPYAAVFLPHPTGHSHGASSIDIGFVTYAFAGAVIAPSGAAGGWLLWKVLWPHRDATETFDPDDQRANPVTARAVLGLAIAPLLPVVIMTAIMIFIEGDGRLGLFPLEWAVGTAELLSLVAGTALLTLISRQRPIRRMECLCIAAGITMLLPLATYYAGGVLSHFGAHITFSDGEAQLSEITSNLFLGYMMFPAGLPGGWLLWRVAFKNHQSEPAPLSAVFE